MKILTFDKLKMTYLVVLFSTTFNVENLIFRIGLLTVACCCLFLYIKKEYLVYYKKGILIFLLNFLLITGYFFIEIFFRGKSYLVFYIIFALSFLNVFILASTVGDNVERVLFINKCLKGLIVLYIVPFVVQNFMWYLNLGDFDPTLVLGITSEPQRSLFYGGLYRGTSFFSEPSIFSAIILSLVVLSYYIDNKLKLVHWIGIGAAIASLSTVGLLMSVSVVVVVYARLSIKSILIGLCFLLIILYFSYDNILFRLDLFESGSDGSNNLKILLINDWFKNSDIFYFGYSLLDKSRSNYGLSLTALGDLGLVVNNFMYFGVVIGGLLFVTNLIGAFSSSFKFGLLFFIITIKLSTFTFPATSLFIGLAYLLISFKEIKKQASY